MKSISTTRESPNKSSLIWNKIKFATRWWAGGSFLCLTETFFSRITKTASERAREGERERERERELRARGDLLLRVRVRRPPRIHLFTFSHSLSLSLSLSLTHGNLPAEVRGEWFGIFFLSKVDFDLIHKNMREGVTDKGIEKEIEKEKERERKKMWERVKMLLLKNMP